MKRKYLIISTVCLLLSGGIHSQVTIGSGTKPVPGALLDLKDGGSYGATGATAVKGLGLPRVKLEDVAKLKMSTNEILDTDNGGNQYTKHTGLIVYNVSGEAIPKCAPIPDGLYVWDGVKWQGMGVTKADPAILTLSGASTYNIASGLGALPITAETFNVTWSPANPLPYITTSHATFGGVAFNNITASPLAASPASFSLKPATMSATEVTANPFRTRESTLRFDVASECGSVTKTITINQTNKALTVSTPTKEYTVSAPNTTNTLTTNADWKLATIMPNDATNAISNVRVGSPAVALPTNTTQTGYEQNNNTGKAATLTYDIAVAATKARYSILTFADAAATKRFADVTITVLQCTNVGQNPTIEQWALTAGFTQAQVDAVKTTGTDSPILATGIQLHRDQSNNLFLSSSFHSTNITGTTNTDRWMIHNLAATGFATTGRTGSDNTVLQNFGTSPSGVSNYLTPLWAYPKANGTITVGEGSSTEFRNNPRLGRLYNWAAATNSRGNTTNGQQNINDGENVTIARPTIQGICPSGWHLPSDVEWTQLENELNTNTTAYSSAAANANGTIPIGGTSFRGTTHGKAMKEACEPYDSAHKGTSNGINSTDRPGFDCLYAGYARGGSTSNFGSGGHFWSASGNGTSDAWVRYFAASSSQVTRITDPRHAFFSVRCKK